MKQKIDFKYRSFGIRILLSVILIFSACLLLTAYFIGKNYWSEQRKKVALETEMLSEKTMRKYAEMRIGVENDVYNHRHRMLHPDSAKIICQQILMSDSDCLSKQNCLILVDSVGNYFKSVGADFQYSLNNDINYLDSIRLLWGQETYADVLRAIRESDYQTIREINGRTAYLCITSRSQLFDAMLWKVDMDYVPIHNRMFRSFAAMFLVSLLLLCLIGYLNMRKLSKLVRSEERYETEIKDASMIQREMLPSSPLNSPSIDLDAVLLPSAAVGGDCYYYYEKNGLLYFCIGDVVGKGLGAALFMSKVVSLFHNISQYHSEADTIAECMNRELCTGNDDLMFVTMFIAILDVRTGELRYCNAGHEDPVFWSGVESDRPVIIDTCHDVALGIEPDVSFTQSVMHIAPGAVLSIYTDGVTEAKNDALNMFGSTNLLEAFRDGCRKDSKSLNSTIVSAVKGFADRHLQSDDITILTIKARPIEYSVTLENTEKETEKLRDLFAYLRNFLYCSDSQLMDIRVAVDEAVTNCINYAYGSGKGLITVRVSSEPGGIVFTIKDEGIPFNLLEYDCPERSDVTMENVELGGLGIPLIKRTFDCIEYRRDGDCNILKLRKTIDSI